MSQKISLDSNLELFLKPLVELSYSEAQLVTFLLEPLRLRDYCDLYQRIVDYPGYVQPEYISAYHVMYHAHMAFNGPFVSTDAHFASIRSIFNALLHKIQAGFISEPFVPTYNVDKQQSPSSTSSSSSSSTERSSPGAPAPNVPAASSTPSPVHEAASELKPAHLHDVLRLPAFVGDVPLERLVEQVAATASKVEMLEKALSQHASPKESPAVDLKTADAPSSMPSSSSVKKVGKLPKLKHVFSSSISGVRSIVINGSDYASRKMIALNLVNSWVNSQVTNEDSEKDIRQNRLIRTSDEAVLQSLYENRTVHKKTRCIVIEVNNSDSGRDFEHGFGYVDNLRSSASALNLLVIVIPHATIFNHSRPYWFQSFDLAYILQSNTTSVIDYVRSVSPETLHNSVNYPQAGLDAFYSKKRQLSSKCIVISSMSGRTYTVLRTDTSVTGSVSSATLSSKQ